MSQVALHAAVERLARVFHAATDAQMGMPWAWSAYEDEGARFALLRACEELRELAVLAYADRVAADVGPTQAQRILSQYHAAYRELEAILFGLDDEMALHAPAEHEWPVREAVSHIVGAEAAFFGCCRHAVERYRAGDTDPAAPPEDAYDRLLGSVEDHRRNEALPLSGLRKWHADINIRIMTELADVHDAELDLPSRYWEPEPYPLRFRLHRFESHLRQHSIQVEKILAAIGRPPSEAMRLIRLMYAALASFEGAWIGAPGGAAPRAQRLAATLNTRADELADIFRARNSDFEMYD